ncbi:hypothetical protein QTH89_23705 [Variovorax sp. J22G21]|uniref:hypothetical protein n=1 Tax=Variovorax fucosicus TaxID=3053517 RepID=UPI0025763AF7|nr:MULTISPECIES: hypothetical protein [unclassified Variovorax]MDM0039465.1 hypothetical protein [Variovorax sp. J22R193]MDM0064240.1 hypothetical protein [Variovorax sp. J22G21]
MDQSLFGQIDRTAFVQRLREDGAAFGLRLPQALSSELVEYASKHACFADRQVDCGFHLGARPGAESKLGKPILVAQYFNAATQCPAIGLLLQDPLLQWIAGTYLESVPTFVGANLWWTFPVQALEEDRDRHAHLFHRDVDDFRFFKFFFYLTDVKAGDGAHVYVVGSHRRPPMLRLGDRWNIRRYSDAEVRECFAPDRIVEICGAAGTGFAENTLCVHKGLTPIREPRLLLQLQYALFDYGAMHDRRDSSALQMIA